jgi:hypothetical protein
VLNERQSDRRSAAKKARTKLLNEVGGVEERGKRRTVATRGWRALVRRRQWATAMARRKHRRGAWNSAE